MGELQLPSKQSYRARRREEDAESIFDPPLHLSPDERSHLRGAGWCVWPLEDVSIQIPGRPRGPRVSRDALLYIGLEQIRGWVLHPLGQASQCIPLRTSKEQQKGGCVEDLPGDDLIYSCQVVRKWVNRRGSRVPVPSWSKEEPL